MNETSVAAFTLILARTATFVAVLPVFQGSNLPRLVKVGLSLALAVMWYERWSGTTAAAAAELSIDGSWFGLSLGLIQEAAFGAFWGFAFSLFLLPLQIAGSYIGQEMGLTLATITDPNTNRSANVISQLFEALGILLFFALDLHHVVFATLNLTFARWPIGTPLSGMQIQQLINGFAEAHELGLLIAAPIGIALFMTIVTLMLLIKASPQLNLFSVGLTLRVGIGLCAVLFFLPELTTMSSHILSHVAASVANLF